MIGDVVALSDRVSPGQTRVRSRQHRLGRHTGDVGALAAEPIGFHGQHGPVTTRQVLSGDFAARTGADHDDMPPFVAGKPGGPHPGPVGPRPEGSRDGHPDGAARYSRSPISSPRSIDRFPLFNGGPVLFTKSLFTRAVILATAATLLVGASSTAAQAATTYTTTGAWGQDVYVSGSSNPTEYNLYAKDPLEDGHCAQWQIKTGDNSWTWYGTRVCSNTVTYVGKAYGKYSYYYRLCRTGVGNCTGTIEFA